MKRFTIDISTVLGLGLSAIATLVLLALLWLLTGSPQVARAADLTVCPTGPPTCNYSTIQAAVDAATDGDVVKVATGVYIGVSAREGVTQVVYVSKTVTIRGGYTTAFTDPPDPEANPTTLDAGRQGRVLFVTGNISPTVEGLRITGGDAAGLGGLQYGWDAGGGVYVISATATISNNHVFSNTANYGGGLHLGNSAATLSGNTVTTNTAYRDSSSGWGGGLSLFSSAATLSDNIVSGNTAAEEGGGLYLSSSDATLSGNTIISNTAYWGNGGGLYLDESAATLSGNTVSTNTANYYGGGLYLDESAATLSGNAVITNTARVGGGLYLDSSPAALSGNNVSSNTATWGGGLVLFYSDATLSGNTVFSNTAWGSAGLELAFSDAMLSGNTVISNIADQMGGGLRLSFSDATLINNVVADNQAGTAGSALHIRGSSPCVLHTTFARNSGGDGSGIYVTNDGSDYSTVALTNTILVSHTVGVTVTVGNAAMLEGTLWGSGSWANDTDWGGAGSVATGTVNLWDDPDFVDPTGGDYHIGAGSAAIDTGVASGVLADIDGDPRPAAFGYDIGADERPGASLHLHKVASPFLLNPGQTLTYTLVITSVGVDTATGVWLTDTLPALQQALSITTTLGSCAAGAGWGSDATCDLGTLAPGEGAHITLTAQVTTTPPAQLPLLMRNSAWVTATETANSTYVDTTLQNCHARLNDNPTDYESVQAAVDASAQPTDVVKVAGTCTGVTSRAGAAQITYISKTLTLQGGWDTAFTQRDVISFPTTLDARRQGRVLYITAPAPGAAISPTVEGFRITGGDAAGLGGAGDDAGGGAYVISATAIISDNQVLNNTAEQGGGLYLLYSDATLSGNTVTANTATGGDPHTLYHGGGLYLWGSNATLSGNLVFSNTASHNGGGLHLYHSDATLVNNLVMDNRAGADSAGSGLYIVESSPRLLHVTLARNSGGDGSGVYVTGWWEPHSTVALTNTILVSHTVGIAVTVGNTATLEATLWGIGAWANGADWGGDGTVVTGTVNLWGDPAFLNPYYGDYHIGSNSAAVDAGVDAGVSVDIDGESRPTGDGYDIGADEFKNTPPTLSGLPDQIFDHATPPTSTIDLWAYVWDEHSAASMLTYTLEITPPIGAGVSLESNRYVTVTPSTDWCGYTDVTVRATDPGGLWDTDTFRVAVTWSCKGPLYLPVAMRDF